MIKDPVRQTGRPDTDAPAVDRNRQVGLIGWPVEHSVSPAMHNAAFAALGLRWHYTLLPTPPGGVQTVMHQLRSLDFQGANVTVPHKQAVMPYLDHVTDAARAIGAVNTIVLGGGSGQSRADRPLTGYNTDGGGFLAALQEAGFEPSGRCALVLGAGGGARAVAHALVRAGCSVMIHNRGEERAARLASDLQDLHAEAGVSWLPGDLASANLDLAVFDLLVNATSVGMWPDVDASPWPETLALPPHWMVFDLVYNPAETRLLARASAAGAKAVGGLGMLVHQGALAFELWTGCSPPVDVMYTAAHEALHGAVPGAA